MFLNKNDPFFTSILSLIFCFEVKRSGFKQIHTIMIVTEPLCNGDEFMAKKKKPKPKDEPKDEPKD